MPYTQNSTDEELLRGCLGEDRMAQYWLHRRHYGRLLAICMRYAGSREDAEEMLNEAFCRIFQNAATYEGRGVVAAWMSRITLYTSIDHVRKHTRYRQVKFPEHMPEQPVYNPALENMAIEELYGFIQELPPASRAIFSLYVIDGFTHPEIAGSLGISTGTSKWHLNRARGLLQEAIQKTNLL